MAMMGPDGAVGAAKRLMVNSHIQSGSERLKRMGREDPTVERVVLDRTWAPLFDDADHAASRAKRGSSSRPACRPGCTIEVSLTADEQLRGWRRMNPASWLRSAPAQCAPREHSQSRSRAR